MKLFGILGFVVLFGVYVFARGGDDTPAGATYLELNRVTHGTVSQFDDSVDWWRIYVPEPGRLVVFMDGHQDHDIDLYFYNANLDLLARSTGKGEGGVVYGQVKWGHYYIKVQTYFRYQAAVDYDIGALFVDNSAGYLFKRGDIDRHLLCMYGGRTYWIFLVDRDSFFDPDLFLVRDDEIVARSQSSGDIDVIKWAPGTLSATSWQWTQLKEAEITTSS